REPAVRDGAGELGELDAILAQQAARTGDVRHDRLVRVDEVGVARLPLALGAGARRAAARLAGERAAAETPPRSGEAVRALRLEASQHPDEAEVAVHRPLLVVHARSQELPRALLGAALPSGIAQLATLGAAARPAGAPPVGAGAHGAHGDRKHQCRG